MAQPRVTDPPRLNLNPPQQVSTPPGHYSNPLDNMIAVASRLAALPVEAESPAVVGPRKDVELLQTAVAQQAAYSYSRERIHSTPRQSRSYNRHIELPAVSSSERRCDLPVGITRRVMITTSRIWWIRPGLVKRWSWWLS